MSVPLSCVINTDLSANDVAFVPPCATGRAVSNVKDDSSAAEPLTKTFFQLAIFYLLYDDIFYSNYKYNKTKF